MFSAGAAGRRVLLVEDDILTREAVTLVLAAEGYMVAAAGNGRQALEWLHSQHPPDLIVLDLKMPGMDGREFRRRQAEDAALAAIPVLVVSARGDARQQADELGAVACLQKPVETGQLLEAVRRCCGSSPVGERR